MMKGQMKGITDVWDIPTINNMAKERLGYSETISIIRTYS